MSRAGHVGGPTWEKSEGVMKHLGWLLAMATLVVAGLCLVGCEGLWKEAGKPSGLGLSGKTSQVTVVPLYADSTRVLGELRLWNDATNLYVQFCTQGALGWMLDKTHVAACSCAASLPHNGQDKPVYNRYRYKMVHHGSRSTYTAILAIHEGCGPGTTVCVAAHATVVDKTNRQYEDVWGGLNRLPGEKWACYATHVLE